MQPAPKELEHCHQARSSSWTSPFCPEALTCTMDFMIRKLPRPKINLRRLRLVLVSLIVILGSFTLGYWAASKGFRASLGSPFEVTISREIPANRQSVNFSLFWRVWDTLDEDYFDKTKLVASDMVFGAIKGLVSAIGDPYTVFLPPDENKIVQEDLQGTFEGVGIQIGFKGTRLAVIAPLPDSPAEEAGIRAGDLIIGIKDTNKDIERGTVGITLPEAVELIRGPAGSKVTLILLRGDSEEPLEIEVSRKSIDVPSVILSFVGENESIAHLRVLKFSGETNGGWETAVGEILKRSNLAGIVLDVRNNPGGFLQGSVDTASEFLRNQSVVVIEEDANGQRTEFKVNRLGRFINTPVIVLVNQGSASASEILAGALRDVRGIKLVGETTFGKGTIQEPLQLDGGSGLHITAARWLTPKGVWVNEVGLEPDILVEDDPETPEDEQLLEAINNL